MRTDALIALIARDAVPAGARRFAPMLGGAALLGAAVSALALIAWLGMRPMHAAMHSPSFWMKAAYTLLIAVAGLAVTARLARPGGRMGPAIWLAIVAVVWLSMMAGMETMRAPAGSMGALWLGHTWAICPARIIVLATPVFVAALIVLRRMAPTRPTLAGGMAGLLAGALGASVYGLYCQETAAAFVVAWYSLGMAACAALGAAIGGRLLRW